jgi:outer membrane protein, heavy metal efflux system
MKSSLLKYIFGLSVFVLSSVGTSAQKLISEQEAVDLALKNSGAFGAADLQIQQNKFQQRSALNLPNPELIAESPSGEFYAVGILQSLEFPTVYSQQTKLRKQMTRLSEKQKEVTRQDIARLIRTLYLNAQFSQTLAAQLAVQDTLYSNIAKSAKRQFDAGTIDYLAKTFAESQAGEIHNQRMAVESDYRSFIQQLMMYTRQAQEITTAKLTRFRTEETLAFDTTNLLSSPRSQYYQQLLSVNQRSLSLERNRALPGLVVGYLNQGSRETETFYRFRVGVTLPIWFWQYSGNIKAAKTGVSIAEQELKSQQQMLSSEMIEVTNNVQKFSNTLNYYEQTGIMQAEDVIKTARRFFESGQSDYIQFLRNVNEAYLIKTRYLEALRNYNEAQLTLDYLNGKL